VLTWRGKRTSYKRGAYRGKNKKNNSLQGNIAELSKNVYQYGTWDQGAGDRFTRTTEAISNYGGREYSKEMRVWEPVMLDKAEAKLPFIMKKYEIFVIVKGQYTLNMTNKVESLQGYGGLITYFQINRDYRGALIRVKSP
jgi:hypothetical protein